MSVRADYEHALEEYTDPHQSEAGKRFSEPKCPQLLPPCWTREGRWYDIEKRCYVDPPAAPVYVRIGGRKREAVRWLWLWRIVAWIQEG